MSIEAELTRLRSLVERLVKARCDGRLRRLPEVWDSDPATQIRHGAQAAIRVLAESLEHGGYSAAQVVERLREEGVPVTISCLHGEGLQAVTNALVDWDDMARALEKVPTTRRCAFCDRPHPVSDRVAEENRFCAACLHERVARRAASVETDDRKVPRVLKVGDRIRLKRTKSVEPVTQILSPYEVMTIEGYPPIRSHGYPWWELWEHEDGAPILPLNTRVRDE